MSELKLRMKESLRDAISKAAADRETSMNAEIIRRLEQSFQMDRVDVKLDAIGLVLHDIKGRLS